MSQAEFITGQASQTFGNPSQGNFFIIDQDGRLVARLTNFVADGINLIDMAVTDATVWDSPGPASGDESGLSAQTLAGTSWIGFQFTTPGVGADGLPGYIDLILDASGAASAVYDVSIWTNSSGHPGSKIANSASNPTGMSVEPGSVASGTQYRLWFTPTRNTALSGDTVYWLVLHLDGVGNDWTFKAPLMDTGTVTGHVAYSTDGAAWSSIGGRGIFQLGPLYTIQGRATGGGSIATEYGNGLTLSSEEGFAINATSENGQTANLYSRNNLALSLQSDEANAFQAISNSDSSGAGLFQSNGALATIECQNTGPGQALELTAPDNIPPLVIDPGSSTGAPTGGSYSKGMIYVDGAGDLFIYNGTAWKKVTVS